MVVDIVSCLPNSYGPFLTNRIMILDKWQYAHLTGPRWAGAWDLANERQWWILRSFRTNSPSLRSDEKALYLPFPLFCFRCKVSQIICCGFDNNKSWQAGNGGVKCVKTQFQRCLVGSGLSSRTRPGSAYLWTSDTETGARPKGVKCRGKMKSKGKAMKLKGACSLEEKLWST